MCRGDSLSRGGKDGPLQVCLPRVFLPLLVFVFICSPRASLSLNLPKFIWLFFWAWNCNLCHFEKLAIGYRYGRLIEARHWCRHFHSSGRVSNRISLTYWSIRKLALFKLLIAKDALDISRFQLWKFLLPSCFDVNWALRITNSFGFKLGAVNKHTSSGVDFALKSSGLLG